MTKYQQSLQSLKPGKSYSPFPSVKQPLRFHPNSYAFGLLSITPLGDLVRRRPLLLLIPSISTLFTISMALAPNITTLKILSFFLGIFTVTPQILLPFAADLAPEHRRSTALSIVLSGLLLGIIVARALGGVIADISHSWRNVYWMGAGLQMIALVLLYSVLPDWPGKTDINTEINTGKPGIVVERKKKKKLTYLGILWTMAKLSVTEPLLVQCYLIIFSASMVFSTFWVTLTFLLSGSPYNFSTYVPLPIIKHLTKNEVLNVECKLVYLE